MKLYIYQSYYEENQKIDLDVRNFIPYDNVINAEPLLREQPLHKKIYEKHFEEPDAYWGLVSWKWALKTRSTGTFFTKWIKDNPGYDLYFVDPHIVNAAGFKNPFIDGDVSHPGLMDFSQRMVEKLNLSIDLKRDGFHPDLFSTCTFWVGNKTFWDGWFAFWDQCVELAKTEKDLHQFMFGYSDKRHLGFRVINYPFIHERFISFYLYAQNNLRWIKYSYDSKIFYNKVIMDNEFGPDQGALVFYKLMYLLNKKINFCGKSLIKAMSDEQFGHKSPNRTPDGSI